MKLKTGLMLAGMLIALTVVLRWYLSEPITSQPVAADTPRHRDSHMAPQEIAPTQSDIPIQEQATETERERVRNYLRERFATRIHHAHARVKALEKLVSYLMANFPDSWRDLLASYLQDIFPEHAEQMLALYANMEAYNQWVEAERQNMLQLSPQERRQLMWDMRYSFFGEAANEIWSEALKNEQIARSLENMDAQQGFDANTAQFIASIGHAYGERANKVMGNRRQELADRFISTPVIQQQLKAMPDDKRYAALADFRRQLGMDEAAIARWTVLDQQRDQRWEKGHRYMERRAELAETLTGDALDTAVAALQDELFGAEAEILRNEEASGYFRFLREQIIGRE